MCDTDTHHTQTSHHTTNRTPAQEDTFEHRIHTVYQAHVIHACMHACCIHTHMYYYVPVTHTHPCLPTHPPPSTHPDTHTHTRLTSHPPTQPPTHSPWAPHEECRQSQSHTTAEKSCHRGPRTCLADPPGEHQGRNRTGGPRQVPLRTLAQREEGTGST